MLTEKFWNKIRKTKTCWTWEGCRNKNGYGLFSHDGRLRTSHRVIWEDVHGEIPKGMFICHKCDNPPCCNPEHLFLGDHKMNMQDRDSKGRQMHGSNHFKTSLTEDDVVTIRSLYGKLSIPQLAKKFNVGYYVIYNILYRKSWRHVPVVDGQVFKLKRFPRVQDEFSNLDFHPKYKILLRRRSLGFCRSCKSKVTHGGFYCDLHWKIRIEYQRRYRAKRKLQETNP